MQNIFYQGNKRKLVPSSAEPHKQKTFFDCVACLMTSNLQSLTLNSLIDYENIFVSPPTSVRMYEHPGMRTLTFIYKYSDIYLCNKIFPNKIGFVLRLILADTEIKYEPSFHDFEVSMLNMVDIIIKSCANIPRVETRLYSDSAIQVFNFFVILYKKKRL